MSTVDRDPVGFFYEHAGYSWNAAQGEGREEGHQRTAEALAAAYRLLRRGPYWVSWEADPEPWDGEEPYDGPVWIATLYALCDVDGVTEPTVLGSLGGIAAEEGDEYTTVIEAELAVEYLGPRGEVSQ